MAWLLVLALAAPEAEAVKVPELAKLLKRGETGHALVRLKEIGRLKGNDAEALALIKVIRDRRVPKPPEVLEACFLALKGIGSRKATRPLLRLLDHSVLGKLTAVRVGVCRALEGSADPAGADALLKLLRDPKDEVVAAAAQAAGAYREARESLRKKLFEVVMNLYVATWNVKNTVDPSMRKEKRRAEKRWEIVAAPMERALQLLSNVVRNSPPEWRRWWNKNKHKRWDAPER